MRSPLILFNANLYLGFPEANRATALVIADDRILACGESQRLLDKYGTHAQKLDLQGMTILPGLTDAHIHLQQYALALQKVVCETGTKAECLRNVAERIKAAPPGSWILGHGWNQNHWVDGFGHRSDLDALSHQHPIYLTAKSLHAGWANSAALHLAGITANTPNPPGGYIGRDGDGQPNGILFEAAMQAVSDAIPAPQQGQITQAIKAALPSLWELGLTGVHDFDRRECFQALQSLDEQQALKLRVTKGFPLESLPHLQELGLQSGFGSHLLRIGALKAFADGALGPKTAAMLEPYMGDPENTGMLLLDREELFEKGRLAVDYRYSLAIHAIGDRANHEVLAALSQLRTYELEHSYPPARHRIEHVQLLHPDDAPYLAKYGIVASMQPVHAISDMEMATRHWGARTRLGYAWRTQVEQGAVLAFGSDAPVESPNPFKGLHAAITRRKPGGAPGPDGWHPEQRISLQDALAAYTRGPAYAAGQEKSQGCLLPGFYADLLVLERDPLNIPPDELLELTPSATMVAGEWVYKRDVAL